MFETNLGYWKISFFIAAAMLISISAVADEAPEELAACVKWMETNLEDEDLGNECRAAMAAFETIRPAREPVEVVPRPPSAALVVAESIAHDGDRESIAQTLRSGESVDIIVEFEVRDVLVEASEMAIGKGLRTLGSAEMAYKRREFSIVKEAGLAGLQGVGRE